jgi:hypothetical protein
LTVAVKVIGVPSATVVSEALRVVTVFNVRVFAKKEAFTEPKPVTRSYPGTAA